MFLLTLVLKTVIYYIHLVTRTPLIILYFMVTCYGLFADPSFGSRFCFYIFVTTILLNIFLVLIFNNRFTKQKAINAVGYDFYSKYLSHSAAGAKSLARLMSGSGLVAAVELSTSVIRDFSHTEGTNRLRGDVEKWARVNNRGMAEKTQQVVNEMEKQYVYGGVISDSCRAMQKSENKQKVIQTIGECVNSVFGKDDKNKNNK